jgi:hypothetical protein
LLLDGVELDPVQQGVGTDGTRVSGSSAKGLGIGFPGESQVRLVDRGERDQLDRVDLDLTGADPIAATGLDFRSLPQPERHRDVAGQDVGAQFLAELHRTTLLLAVLATIAAARTDSSHGSLVSGYRLSFLAATGVVVLAFAVVLLGRIPRRESPKV